MEIHLHKTDANEKELLELILQFFYENKFVESAKLLESKANIIYDQNEIQQLKLLLKNHKFDEAIAFLESSNFENFQKAEVIKILKSRKFLEMMKEEKFKKENALDYLRTELAPIINDKSLLNKFSALLFQKEKELQEKHLKQNFEEICSDEIMITKIQSLLCLSLDSNGNRILPNSRLEALLNAYKEMASFSMDVDEENCSELLTADLGLVSQRSNKPDFQRHLIIEKFDDEVWHLEMTRSNRFFATCSRNGIITIFKNIFSDSIEGAGKKILKVECLNFFLAHKKYLTSMQWSLNEKHLITASHDKSIKLWNPFEGKCLKTLLVHTDIVTSVKWLNDDQLVSGGIDKKLIICTTGNRVICSELFSRIRKVLISEAMSCIIIIPASMNDIILYDHKNYREIGTITELDPIISANLSVYDDGRFLITNISKVNASINLYDLKNLSLINKFYGHSQEQYVIECAFAGDNDQFIICGSEDACIYIWHRSNSSAISVIKGHTGSINSCILSFFNQTPFLYSVSDDHTLRIWSQTNSEVTYVDTTIKKGGNKKNSELYKENTRMTVGANININEYNNLIDNDKSEESEGGSLSEHVQGNESIDSDNS